MARRINPRQLRFVGLYVRYANGTQAATEAGYGGDPEQVAWKLLKNPLIQAHIERWQRNVARKVNLDLVEVIDELKPIAFSNVRDYLEEAEPLRDEHGKAIKGQSARWQINLNLASREELSAIKKLKVYADGTVSLELHDKHAALMDLGRHLGMRLGRFQVEQVPPASRPDVSMLDAEDREALRKICEKMERRQKAPQIEGETSPADDGDDHGTTEGEPSTAADSLADDDETSS